uniref:DNA polymerase epsilon catalytic subunit n=1 Tax=Parascaris equorum TaxID=6256 RepID=A0A914S1G9_PAREQ
MVKIIDWEYYIERVGGTIQKIVTIPAALQNVPNPVPRIPFPDWLEGRRRRRANDHKQPKITDMFKPVANLNEALKVFESAVEVAEGETKKGTFHAVIERIKHFAIDG